MYLSGTIGDAFHTWPLEEAKITVGRSSSSAIQIVDATVSKHHAEIEVQNGQLTLRDLGSRNGTRVNGTPVKDAVLLKTGDRVEIGHVPLHITADEPTLPTKFNDSQSLSSSLRIPVNQILMSRDEATESSTSGVVHLLAEAGQLLILPRPLKETCDEILKVVERAIPSTRLILLLKTAEDLEPVQMAARYHGGNATEPLVISRAIMNKALDDCSSVLVTDAAADPRFRERMSIVSQAVHSAIAVPLFDNEKVLGLIYADTNDLRVAYTKEQLEILTLVGNMAAVKITNARLLTAEQNQIRMTQELATATQIQMGLLPAAPPDIPGYEFKAFLETCHEVGGDLYDYCENSDGSVYFLLGDVSGKGMGAAMLMSSVMTSTRVLFDACTEPADMITRLNAIIHRSTDPAHFLTAFLGKLHPDTGRLEYVNAGHNPPYILKDGKIEELASTGLPIGMLPGASYESATIELQPGSLFALFTDGIPEAKKGEEFFEEERLTQILLEGCDNRLEDLSNRIISDVDKFLAGEHRGDDITLMLLRRH